MRIDLHTHSDRSDGTDSPAELVRRAAAAGVDVLGLTDHDTAAGWPEAAAAAEACGVRLVPGIEISTRHRGAGVHLLGYLVDPAHPGLAAELERIVAGRERRIPAVVGRLRDLGIDLTEDDVRSAAGEGAVLGRPHVADALVARGVVADRDEAFARLLGPGGPAYVARHEADLATAVRLVAEAGGVSVVAHPWGRLADRSALDRAELVALRDAGLAGLEVDHEDHDPATRAELRALAGDLDLVVTGSSDYHGAGKTGHALLCNRTDPAELDRLLGRVGAG